MATGRQVRTKGFSIVRLRRWLLACLLFLVAVLAGVLGYARYRARRLLTDLPHRLGIDIKSETNGFTYSQTVKGRTIFTIHAAKAIQRENGKTTLHDVAITLYGPPGSNRTDSIRGAEFEYDQPNGVIKAMGDTTLDLALPSPGAGAQSNPDARRAQVTSSGLIFLQKLGVAATDQPIHLLYGCIHGDATGADYESDTGVLRLRSNVRLDGVQNGRTIHVDAAAAEMDRNTQLATLHTAHVTTGKDRAAGDTVLLALRKDGSVETVNADGHAAVEGETGFRAQAQHLRAAIAATGKLESAELHGAVQLQAENGTGGAADALLHFDAAGKPVRVQLQHAVELHEQRTHDDPASTLTADTVDAELMQEGTRTVLRHATASGKAVFRSIAAVAHTANSPPEAVTRTTVVHASTLDAQTGVAAGKRYVSVIEGTGATRVEESDTEGNLRVSTGDTLHAVLHPPGTRPQAAGQTGSLDTAVQTGHVIVTQHTPATPRKAAQESHATAERAEFDTATQRLLLTGSPVVTSPGMQLAAQRIALTQENGEAMGEGSVKGTFAQNAANGGKLDDVHVLADRAEMAGAGGTAHFYGTQRPARMWSSTGQLQAPQIDLDRTAGTLFAHVGSAQGSTHTVHLTLAGAVRSGSPSSSSKGEPAGPTEISGSTIWMTSATASAPGHIDVSGTARMVNGNTEVTAGKLLATLRSPVKSNETKQDRNTTLNAFNQGSIESIMANGRVHLQQPGRTGTGDRLLYTAADDRYQLTGTAAVPPRITDSLHGNVTGTTLVFHGADQTLDIMGEQGRPVRTETEAGRPAHNR